MNKDLRVGSVFKDLRANRQGSSKGRTEVGQGRWMSMGFGVKIFDFCNFKGVGLHVYVFL